MGTSVHATIVALRHVEDEVSLARSKTSEQALDTVAQAVPNVSKARECLMNLVATDTDPLRQRQLTLALNHVERALQTAETVLRERVEASLRLRLHEIAEHLINATTFAEDA